MFGRSSGGLGSSAGGLQGKGSSRLHAFDPLSLRKPETGRSSAPSKSRVARVEAALWLAGEPLTLRRLARVAGLEGVGEARRLCDELSRRLVARRSALEVIEVAGGVRLMTRPAYAPWLERFAGTDQKKGVFSAIRLSQAAAETLAIVAYRQPAVRAEVEAIRGVGCGDVLRQLLDHDLLRIVGRSEELGKPLLYGTTGRFLELYGLGNLDDLPGRDEETGDAEPTKDNAAHDNAA